MVTRRRWIGTLALLILLNQSSLAIAGCESAYDVNWNQVYSKDGLKTSAKRIGGALVAVVGGLTAPAGVGVALIVAGTAYSSAHFSETYLKYHETQLREKYRFREGVARLIRAAESYAAGEQVPQDVSPYYSLVESIREKVGLPSITPDEFYSRVSALNGIDRLCIQQENGKLAKLDLRGLVTLISTQDDEELKKVFMAPVKVSKADLRLITSEYESKDRFRFRREVHPEMTINHLTKMKFKGEEILRAFENTENASLFRSENLKKRQTLDFQVL